MPTLPRNLGRSATLNRTTLHVERLEGRDAPSATPLPAAVVSAPAVAVVTQAPVVTTHAAAPAAQVNGGAVSALFAGGDPTNANDVHTGLSDTAFSQALQANPSAVLGGSASPASVSTKVTSTVKLTDSASRITAGQSETFTATVTARDNLYTPSSLVTFKDGSTVLGTVRLDAHGVARLTVSRLALGTHHITAVYGGDGHVYGSTSAALTVTVTAPVSKPAVRAATTTVTLKVVGGVPTSDQSLMLVAAVSPAKAGLVTILDGSKVLGQLDLDRSGKAALALSLGLSAGRHNLTVNYVSADGTVRASGALALTIAQGESIWG